MIVQKSTHFPLTYQSPNLVGSGPFGLKPYSGYIGLAVAFEGPLGVLSTLDAFSVTAYALMAF
jgi:hypothetical protein